MIDAKQSLLPATLLLLGALAGNARAADGCETANQLIEDGQTRPLAGELAHAQQALKLCDSFNSQLFMAHVQAARKDWDAAESAYGEARGLAGGNLEQVSQVDMERALLLALQPGRTCQAVAAFDDAAAERRDRDLGPPPAWFTDRRRAVEGAWNRDGLSATELGCTLTTRRSFILRAMKDNGAAPGTGHAWRKFCSEMTVSIPVQFASGSARLSASGQRQVVALADAVRPLLQDDHLRLDGHADETGPESINQELSTGRAGTVAAELSTLLHLPPQRTKSIGHGSKEPKYPGHTGEDLRLNRRVELTLVPAECPL